MNRSQAERDRQARCPNPHKRAWGTKEVAEQHLTQMRNAGKSEGNLHVYQCECGYYHLGRTRYL